MTWVIRAVDLGGAAFEREIPDSGGNIDLFTIKLHFGGNFEANPKSYVGDASFVDLYYKVPKASMEDGIFPITSDSQVVEMCTHLDSTRLLLNICLSQPFDPIDDPAGREFERKQLEDLLEFDGIPLEMFDLDGIIDSTYGKDILIEVSDHEKGSLHEYSSNIDRTDEDLGL
ncbi:hypothetical protein ACET3Z_032257 [Daucus carota]